MSRTVWVWRRGASASKINAVSFMGEDVDSGFQVPFPYQKIIGVEGGNDKDGNTGFF